MTNLPPMQDPMKRSGRVRHRLAWWRCDTAPLGPPPDPERVPSVEQALEQDAHTRWIILVILSGVEAGDVRFLTTMTRRASTEEGQRSLNWLVTAGCITEQRHWKREYFWQQRREVRIYAITPMGTALLAHINDTATAEQLGIQAEPIDPQKPGPRRWRHAVYLALYVALLALTAAVVVPLLIEQFR